MACGCCQFVGLSFPGGPGLRGGEGLERITESWAGSQGLISVFGGGGASRKLWLPFC